jgi:hypothetical protein
MCILSFPLAEEENAATRFGSNPIVNALIASAGLQLPGRPLRQVGILPLTPSSLMAFFTVQQPVRQALCACSAAVLSFEQACQMRMRDGRSASLTSWCPHHAQELFRTPYVSYLYERGWRNSFAQAGFPGIDKEYKLVLDFFQGRPSPNPSRHPLCADPTSSGAWPTPDHNLNCRGKGRNCD